MLRLVKYNKTLKKMTDAAKINPSIMRLATVLVSVFFLVHLLSCFWFLFAKLDNLDPDTWVVRNGYVDSSAKV
jgi:hypothetical protein